MNEKAKEEAYSLLRTVLSSVRGDGSEGDEFAIKSAEQIIKALKED